MNTNQITESTAKLFKLRQEDEYATVLVEFGKESAYVIADSSFGTYAYHWGWTGHDPLKFLSNISFDSAMTKFTGNGYMVADIQRNQDEFKRRLFAARKLKEIEKYEAREFFEEIESLDQYGDLTSSQFQGHIFNDTQIAQDLFDENFWDYHIHTKPNSESLGFWKYVWIPLIAHLNSSATTTQLTE